MVGPPHWMALANGALSMSNPFLPWIAAAIFFFAVLHTFCTKYFEHLAHTQPRHAGLWHLLGEVEIVFGLWAMVLAFTLFAMAGKASTLDYLESRDFTEPLFVFAIMVVAGSRPILQACSLLVQRMVSQVPFPRALTGWRAAVAVILNAALVTLVMRRELLGLGEPPTARMTVPATGVVIHLTLLLGIVLFAHHPVVFMGLLLFFIGYAHAYASHQDRLIVREALLVAFFLAGLVVLGGLQSWWLQPLLLNLSTDAAFYGAVALTAFTDNAALTYLGSLVDGLSEEQWLPWRSRHSEASASSLARALS